MERRTLLIGGAALLIGACAPRITLIQSNRPYDLDQIINPDTSTKEVNLQISYGKSGLNKEETDLLEKVIADVSDFYRTVGFDVKPIYVDEIDGSKLISGKNLGIDFISYENYASTIFPIESSTNDERYVTKVFEILRSERDRLKNSYKMGNSFLEHDANKTDEQLLDEAKRKKTAALIWGF